MVCTGQANSDELRQNLGRERQHAATIADSQRLKYSRYLSTPHGWAGKHGGLDLQCFLPFRVLTSAAAVKGAAQKAPLFKGRCRSHRQTYGQFNLESTYDHLPSP
jgi:hypothetical protein